MVLNVIEWLKAKSCRCCASLESEEEFEPFVCVLRMRPHQPFRERVETAQFAGAQGGPPLRKDPGCQRADPSTTLGNFLFCHQNLPQSS
ncbi:hypothetical protein CEXT_39561 [Caerostris extrusa]|uniref:Uncharacterized protein n=1 Tax=Caerostris extrusa TaxID=172846 RepID=A0AAV4UA97_CAEEX|nr:hypothetical protein CEXT_39561 [Caerostris extrusa]